MKARESTVTGTGAVSRREFLKTGAVVAAALAAGPMRVVQAAPKGKAPNFLYIVCDQMNLDAMSALGCRWVQTPNLDRLASRGVLFTQSHSTNPVCSPARSALFTGRMPVETGVVHNELAIREGIPNLGEWLSSQAGYDTAYCGKWHLPMGFATPAIKGFRALPSGRSNGQIDDAWVSRSCEAFLRNRAKEGGSPFLLVASFHQPHDICYWMLSPETLVPKELPLDSIRGQLPELPPNHRSRPPGPAKVGNGFPGFDTDLRWRYYLYCYYRMVEMLDQDVGRLLDALEDTGLAEETVVVFTADHGEGAGRHGNVQKWHPYDESMKVPMIWSCPGSMEQGLVDSAHLVSGVDVMSTVCDFAGVAPPPDARGFSLRPLLEGRADTPWREFIVAEWQYEGRIVRTPRHKLVTWGNDPAVQLFDVEKDPWETANIADQPGSDAIIAEHRKMLDGWNASMDVAPVG